MPCLLWNADIPRSQFITPYIIAYQPSKEEVDESFDDLRLKLDALLPSLPSGVQQITVPKGQ